MTPLPPEILAHVLHCAQEGQTLEQQLSTRLNFEKVCKAWFECEFRWKVVVLKGFAAVDAFVSVLISMKSAQAGASGAGAGAGKAASAEEVGSRVKSLRLELVQTDENIKSIVCQLLRKVKNVHTLELFLEHKAIHGDGDCFGTAVSKALAKLTSMRHFSLTGDGQTMSPWAEVSAVALWRLLPKWTKLQSLKFTLCHIIYSASVRGIFASCTELRSLELDRYVESGTELASLWAELPPSARSLRLKSEWRFEPTKRMIELSKNDRALEVARQLHEFLLENDFEVAERGLFDDFVANLGAVTRLTIGPTALTDLGPLADLKSLANLVLTLADHEQPPNSTTDELAYLFGHSTSLKQVAIDPRYDNYWTKEDRQALKKAAGSAITINWTSFAD